MLCKLGEGKYGMGVLWGWFVGKYGCLWFGGMVIWWFLNICCFFFFIREDGWMILGFLGWGEEVKEGGYLLG